uniref:Cytochrome c oxidase copper chaperone n=1 Tax=Silene vulgaris TaxID=42043 RepID=T1RUX2_SILVU|nr:cytochrome c oxidase copper chaperone [Silene vulgaris]
MGGLSTLTNTSIVGSKPAEQNQESVTKTAESNQKPKKKICCACPDTKKLRDECIVQHGEDACSKRIEAHKQCLRAEGFNV